MPGRLDPATLKPAFQCPQLRPLMLAFLDLQAGRVRLTGEIRKRGCKGVTMLDTVIILHIFVMHREGGTRPQNLVDSLHAPRRTIRGSLDRLEECRLVFRNAAGLYFCTPKLGEISNDTVEATLREVGRLSDAYVAYQRVCRRVTPI